MSNDDWQVLIVEDETDSAHVISQILEYYGVEIHLARNGLECLSALQTLSPTLIVMDLALPGLDGWQALLHIRQNPAIAHIPVVAVTAFDSPLVENEAGVAGFDGYFPKPIDAATFMDSLRQIVGVR